MSLSPILCCLLKLREFEARDRQVLLTATGQVTPSSDMTTLYDEMTSSSPDSSSGGAYALTEHLLNRLYTLTVPAGENSKTRTFGSSIGDRKQGERQEGHEDNKGDEKEEEGCQSSLCPLPSTAIQRELCLFAQAFCAVAKRVDISPIAKAAWVCWLFLSLPAIREKQQQQQQEEKSGYVAVVGEDVRTELSAISGDEEANCRYCTFLNPLSQVCEICGEEVRRSSTARVKERTASSSGGPRGTDSNSDYGSDSDSDGGPPRLISDSSSDTDSENDTATGRLGPRGGSNAPALTPALVQRSARNSSWRARMAAILANIMCVTEVGVVAVGSC